MFRHRVVALVMAAAGVLVAVGGFPQAASAEVPQPHSKACMALGKRTVTRHSLSIVVPATNVQQGSRGACVSYAQEMLLSHGFDITVDGVFGSQTRSWVVHFQRATNGDLAVDGIVGPNTWWQLMIIG